jgi:hypothetical protein
MPYPPAPYPLQSQPPGPPLRYIQNKMPPKTRAATMAITEDRVRFMLAFFPIAPSGSGDTATGWQETGYLQQYPGP